VRVNLGCSLYDKGLVDEAIAEYREAIRLKKDYVEAHNNLGVALWKKGRQDEAIAAYREAIRLKKDDALPHYNLGVALADKGRLDEAIAAYREAIRLKKDYVDAHNNLGALLCDRKRDYDGAAAAFREVIRLQPGHVEAHFNLGNALQHKGQLKDAIAAYRETLLLKPDFAGAHNNLAELLASCTDEKLWDPARAVKHAQRAVELAPAEGNCWNTLGVAHYCNGDAKAAVEALSKSVELRQGGDANDFFFLAMAHCRLGHKDQARTWYAKAVLWMDKHKPKDEDLSRYRAEAATLLGVKDRPAPGKGPTIPNK